MTARQLLETLRQEVIERLRAASPLDTAELERIDRMLAASEPSTPVSPNEFAKLQIVDAARVYLSRVKREVPIAELSAALISGGISTKGERPPEWKVSQSVGYHVTRGNLTLIDGKVGLPEWKKD